MLVVDDEGLYVTGMSSLPQIVENLAQIFYDRFCEYNFVGVVIAMSLVRTKRIQYTPSPFAKASLLHLAEVGSLTALKPHTSKRSNLGGFLLLVVEKGSGVIEAAHKQYEVKVGDVAFIDCSGPYAHSTGKDLWTIS